MVIILNQVGSSLHFCAFVQIAQKMAILMIKFCLFLPIDKPVKMWYNRNDSYHLSK